MLQRNCLDGAVVRGDLLQLVGPFERTLKKTDRDGLTSLVCYPVQIVGTEVINGGHRAAAMRRQGVRFVPGLCVRGDVGSSVDPSQVYPS